ncbi:hypothetical protein [Moritella yayanosii]|uniref:Flagellar protein FliT n=1 Tax=Moritella yayanosii TaxID=69539 RepID=A0A330LW91_9GAMM|nr:hypothetical protein [Moritella yayanosii]SQD80492.1 conserved protein of unknown function [Moritella yayanosii]
MIDLKAALMVDITALSEQAKVALLTGDFDNCDMLLQQRQQCIEQLVNLTSPLAADTAAYLTQIITDDAAEINKLTTAKLELESQQMTTKRHARSIDRYLAIKQF